MKNQRYVGHKNGSGMECETCKTEITDGNISAAGKDFCSDICHLRFWKNEIPNLGGRLIDEEDIEKIGKLSGQERKDEYNKLVMFVLNSLDSTAFMLNLHYGPPPEENKE